MNAKRLLRAVSVCLAFGLLAACGNDADAPNLSNSLRGLPTLLSGNKAAPPQVTPEQIASALQGTKDPLIVAQAEATSAQSILLQIERNGPYATFATPTRRTLVLRGGLITSTRGLGGDLMSSDEDGLLAAIRKRQSTQTAYTMRFLTPEDVTVSLQFSCTVKRGQSANLAVAGTNRTGIVMTAECSGSGGSFTNTFIVASNGLILSARQWLGPTLGFYATQYLRS